MSTIRSVAAIAALCGAALVAQEGTVPETARLQRLEQMTARFAPTNIRADLSRLSTAERRVLAKPWTRR
jgi:hypothetical protein